MFTVENVYLAAIIQGLLQVGALLFVRRGNLIANRILALLVGLLILTLWNYFVSYAGLPSYWRTFDYNSWVTPFFWAPTLYIYVGVVTAQVRVSKGVFLKHFSLGIGLFVMQVAIDLLDSTGWLSEGFITRVGYVTMFALYVQMSLYFLACFQSLNSYDRKIRNNFSSIESMNLSWLRRLVGIFAALIALDMCLSVPAVIRQEHVPYLTIFLFGESVAVFAIGYFSLTHSNVLYRSSKVDAETKYSGSPLNDQLSLDLVEKLRTVMTDLQPYKNNELRLSDLAELIGISPHLLSQIINEQCQKNFYGFINEYRTTFAAKLLLDDHATSITQIAYESGFNNRVSFNNAFKKYMGMTPSQYRRKGNVEVPNTLESN